VLTPCEAAAAKEGFRQLELTTTVAGRPLYATHGFTVIGRVEVPTSNGVKVPGARMGKVVDANLLR
jgi:hypothetical protein